MEGQPQEAAFGNSPLEHILRQEIVNVQKGNGRVVLAVLDDVDVTILLTDKKAVRAVACAKCANVGLLKPSTMGTHRYWLPRGADCCAFALTASARSMNRLMRLIQITLLLRGMTGEAYPIDSNSELAAVFTLAHYCRDNRRIIIERECNAFAAAQHTRWEREGNIRAGNLCPIGTASPSACR